MLYIFIPEQQTAKKKENKQPQVRDELVQTDSLQENCNIFIDLRSFNEGDHYSGAITKGQAEVTARSS